MVLDAEKVKEPVNNHVEENEINQGYVNGINNPPAAVPTPKQFEAIKQQKDIWEQGIIMCVLIPSFHLVVRFYNSL